MSGDAPMNPGDDVSPMLLPADEIIWDEHGRAALFGDPQASGEYVFRVQLYPSELDGRPHRHPGAEFGTVLQGVIWVAAGGNLERAEARRLGAGSLIFIPPGVAHALWAEGEATLQIHGPAPRGVTEFLDDQAQAT